MLSPGSSASPTSKIVGDKGEGPGLNARTLAPPPAPRPPRAAVNWASLSHDDRAVEGWETLKMDGNVVVRDELDGVRRAS